MSESDRLELVAHLAANPEAGVVMSETGGVRKLRWAVGNKGKGGGIRVIYYFYDDSVPLLLLNACFF
jgi:hypothetical protein